MPPREADRPAYGRGAGMSEGTPGRRVAVRPSIRSALNLRREIGYTNTFSS